MPRRIQQRRLKGWRKPPGAISVARPSRWGNPFPVESGDHATAVARFEIYLIEHPELVKAARAVLRGRDLMCFCPPQEPCHADVWLRVVNLDSPLLAEAAGDASASDQTNGDPTEQHR